MWIIWCFPITPHLCPPIYWPLFYLQDFLQMLFTKCTPSPFRGLILSISPILSYMIFIFASTFSPTNDQAAPKAMNLVTCEVICLSLNSSSEKEQHQRVHLLSIGGPSSFPAVHMLSFQTPLCPPHWPWLLLPHILEQAFFMEDYTVPAGHSALGLCPVITGLLGELN